MYVIWTHLRFYNRHLFPFAQLPQDFSYLSAFFAEEYFAPIFRRKYDVVFAIPLRSVYKDLHADRETGAADNK